MVQTGSSVCWIDHKTIPFDNLYTEKKMNPENLIRKDEKSSRNGNLLKRSGCQHPGTWGLASRTQTKQAVFVKTVSTSSHSRSRHLFNTTRLYQSRHAEEIYYCRTSFIDVTFTAWYQRLKSPPDKKYHRQGRAPGGRGWRWGRGAQTRRR